jgi:hypothetical protein
MKKPTEIVREYKELIEQIPALIKASGLKENFIYEQIGLRKDLYYRRKNKPELWTFEELERLFSLIER